jgi:hypothetical protein
MTKDEVFEEIRAALNEAQVNTVSKPWHYTDVDIVPQVRSALRNMRIIGIPTLADMDPSGDFTTEPTELEGVLIALFVANRLLSGDLMQKLLDGELGVIFKSGPDMMDTKMAAAGFQQSADKFMFRFDVLVAIALSGVSLGDNVFGSQDAFFA